MTHIRIDSNDDRPAPEILADIDLGRRMMRRVRKVGWACYLVFAAIVAGVTALVADGWPVWTALGVLAAIAVLAEIVYARITRAIDLAEAEVRAREATG
ncbi:hypothetical protein [Longispora albida]|uniref:hypothetical protein n=1 Tax=Longispora albida TaxID=203523 RepID=UPI00036FE328|nr:hypothetical protein [Longispora albida]